MKGTIVKFGILVASTIFIIYLHKLLLIIIPLFIFYTTNQYKKFKAIKAKVESYHPPLENYWSGKTLMVLINPKSGSRESIHYFKHVVEPMMLKAQINLEPIISKGSAHISEIFMSTDITNYDGILCLSGDGTLHQILNSIAKKYKYDINKIYSTLEKCPLGIIPTGTSNGISASFGSFNVFDATKRIIESVPRKIDLCEIRIEKDGKSHKYFDIHSFSWAAIAMYDELVEIKLRWMGVIKHIFASLYLILKNPRFEGKIEIVPYHINDEAKRLKYTDHESLPNSKTDPLAKVIEGNITIFTCMNMPFGSQEFLFAKNVMDDEGAVDLVIYRNPSRWDLISLLREMKDGSHLKRKDVEVYKVKRFKLIPKDKSTVVTSSGEFLKQGNVTAKVHPRIVSVI